MAQFTDLQATELITSRKEKYIGVKIRGQIRGDFFYFTEVEELEDLIANLNQMLNDWRDELALKRRNNECSEQVRR